MSSWLPIDRPFFLSPAFLLSIGLAVLVGSFAVFWLPFMQEWALAGAGASEIGQESAVFLIQAALVLISAGLVSWAASARFKFGFEGVVIVFFLFTMFSAMLMSIATFHSPEAQAIGDLDSALQKTAAAEFALNRATPAGDQLRLAASSVTELMQRRDLIDTINQSSNDPELVLEVLQAAPILGDDHPLVKFATDNGMARADAEQVIYRESIEKFRANPNSSMAAMASRLMAKTSAN